MNNLSLTLIWLIIQVTLLSLVAVVLYGFAARRSPGSGALVAFSFLAAAIALPILAYCPWPSCWIALDPWLAPSHTAASELAPPTERGKPEANPASMFDDAHAILAFRPAAIFRMPGMKQYAESLNKEGLEETLGLPVEEIEQVVMVPRMSYHGMDKKKGERGGIMFTTTLVRSVKDHDWKTHIKHALTQTMKEDGVKMKMHECRHAGRVYYRLAEDTDEKPNPFVICFFLPDRRTVVIDTEEHVHLLLEQPADAPQPRFAWSADWKQVEHNLVAVGIDFSTDHSVQDLKKSTAGNPALQGLLGATYLVCGATCGKELEIHGMTTCATMEKAQIQAQHVEGLFALVRMTLLLAAADDQAKSPPTCIKNLVQAAKVERQDTTVRFGTKVNVNLADAIAAILASFEEPTPN